tara:strand:+ start:82 stop:489 length:408 start_codon:yes stop_codon:yes gene_type:complete
MFDLQLIKPHKRNDNYTKSEVYIIPCIVLEYGSSINNAAREIKVKRINFSTGEIIISKGITFNKSIQIFEEMGKTFPFMTECKVVKKPFNIELIVYGAFNTSGFSDTMLDSKIEYSNKTEYCKKQYKELNIWVKM